VVENMKKDFRPEFLNRIDKIVVYRPLGFDQLKKITALQIKDLQDRLKLQKVELKASSSLIKFISEKSFDPAQGARFIRKNVQDMLEDPIAEKIVADHVRPGSVISADVKAGQISFHVQQTKEKIVYAA
jgi:ATP-dependent Clp protease ATP-binding subunit ClpA